MPILEGDISRRALLRGAATVGLGLAAGGHVSTAWGAPRRHRKPGSLPFPHMPEGTESLPQIEHIIVLMMENHSFDDHLGTLGRGDGFPLRMGLPAAVNPDGPYTNTRLPRLEAEFTYSGTGLKG